MAEMPEHGASSPHYCASVFVPTTVLGGSALWTIEVPNDPVWLGTEFFQQALVLEPGFQPVVSNGGLGRIGG